MILLMGCLGSFLGELLPFTDKSLYIFLACGDYVPDMVSEDISGCTSMMLQRVIEILSHIGYEYIVRR
jgi:hypothetical protein